MTNGLRMTGSVSALKLSAVRAEPELRNEGIKTMFMLFGVLFFKKTQTTKLSDIFIEFEKTPMQKKLAFLSIKKV